MHPIPTRTAATPTPFRHVAPGHTGTSMAHAAPARHEAMDDHRSERDFVSMRAAYRASGGIARGDDLARLLENHQHGDAVTLARLIGSGEVFGFEWHRTGWVPMFQFELRNLSVKAGLRQVLIELSTEFDGWELANWFVRPNCWLKDRRPVDLMDTEMSQVLAAARTDRFVAAG